MPRIKSAIKRVEVAERNRLRNRSWRSAVRTARSAVEESITAADPENAREELNRLYSVIDKAVVKGILHKNSASRKKSRLAGLVQRLAPASGTAAAPKAARKAASKAAPKAATKAAPKKRTTKASK